MAWRRCFASLKASNKRALVPLSIVGSGLLASNSLGTSVVQLEASERRYIFFGPRDAPTDPPMLESPYVYEALTRGTRSRIKREKALREFVSSNAKQIRGQLAHLDMQMPRPVAGDDGPEAVQKRKDLINFIEHRKQEIQEEVELATQVIN